MSNLLYVLYFIYSPQDTVKMDTQPKNVAVGPGGYTVVTSIGQVILNDCCLMFGFRFIEQYTLLYVVQRVSKIEFSHYLVLFYWSNNVIHFKFASTPKVVLKNKLIFQICLPFIT